MRWLYAIFAMLFAIILWQGIVIFSGVPKFILPSPLLVAQTWWEHRALIAQHSVVTLIEIGLGLLIGVAFGCLSALALAQWSLARAMIRPILVFTQALPVFALAPLLTLWLGYGLGSKVAMAVLIIYFPVASAFFDGLVRTDSGYLDLARVMQAKKSAILWHIRVPAALPALASGLRLAAVYAPIGAVIGEWVGSSKGLGYLMLLANGRAKTDLMFAALLTLGVLSVLLYVVMSRATQRWSLDH